MPFHYKTQQTIQYFPHTLTDNYFTLLGSWQNSLDKGTMPDHDINTLKEHYQTGLAIFWETEERQRA